MAIRVKNIDYNAVGLRKCDSVRIGDVASGGTLTFPIIVLPHDAIVHEASIVSKQVFSANSSETMRVTFQVAGTSGTTLATRIANTSGTHSNTISANSKYTLTPGGSNTFSAGTIIEAQFSAICGTLSSVLASIVYSPLIHRGSR